MITSYIPIIKDFIFSFYDFLFYLSDYFWIQLKNLLLALVLINIIILIVLFILLKKLISYVIWRNKRKNITGDWYNKEWMNKKIF